MALAGETMGTNWSVKAYPGNRMDAADVEAAIKATLARVVDELSHWRSDTEISRFNRTAPGTWQAMTPALDRVLAAGLEVAHASAGAFDPAIGRLAAAWGFGPEGRQPAPPEPRRLAAMLAPRGWRAIERRGQFARRTADVALDFSGIGKGYAVDAVAEALRRLGIGHALVEIGGELNGAGIRDDGQPWWVDAEPHPDFTEATPLRIALHGLSIATSGDYRRWFEHDGQRHAHSIDPRTGTPVTNGVASVTVLHRHCMYADAWATALTVLGAEAGMALAEKRGLAVRMLVRDPRPEEFMSTALAAMCG
ncbi:FAD:protein FMN transferase [Sphingomonas zeicaulis]|uniref:FAD:protein FMN transferase n=1 Tax=Sphingomonas zeicaulis TaxID=1632740 RepID=UPI003D1DCD6C